MNDTPLNKLLPPQSSFPVMHAGIRTLQQLIDAYAVDGDELFETFRRFGVKGRRDVMALLEEHHAEKDT